MFRVINARSIPTNLCNTQFYEKYLMNIEFDVMFTFPIILIFTKQTKSFIILVELWKSCTNRPRVQVGCL
jgi:hypothetical protein